MGLVTKTVMVKLGNNYKYYEDLGYKIPKHKNKKGEYKLNLGESIEIKVEDLPKNSHCIVECKCDGCGGDLKWTYQHYNDCNRDLKTFCRECGTKIFGIEKAKNTRLSKSKTFKQWCIENDREDLLLKWDYSKNSCAPDDISFSSTGRYYFKCLKHPEHESVSKKICYMVNNENKKMCKQCNSVAQYILDNFQNKDLYEVWDKDKNGDIDPWKVPRGTQRQKIWIKCQEKDYHGSYKTTPDVFTKGNRCPYCSSRNGKVHPKDSLGQYIINNYSEGFLKKVWSDKNKKSPFEYSVYSSEKVWWKCLDGYHKDYLKMISNSTSAEFRCPKCVRKRKVSIIEEKTETYLKELRYVVLTEYNCTLKPINPKTKQILPFDNEIILSNGKHLIIEVHGDQHYRNFYFKSICNLSEEESNKALRKRQLYDRYKKAYAEHYGYYYLELPYWAFRGKNKNLYKQMIDEKIEEILHDTKAS